MDKNPYQKGTMEYLDWATAQHDKATAPKPKPKPKPAAKPKPKPAPKKRMSSAEESLAAYEAGEDPKARFKDGIKTMLFGGI